MADYQKVNDGDDLVIPAQTYNSFIDAAVYVAQSRADATGDGRRGANDQATTINALNIADEPVDRFRAVAIKAPVALPEDNEDEFLNAACNMTADLPVEGDEGRWGVTLEGIDSQAFGRVVVSGVTVCWINLTDTGHDHVEVVSGSNVVESGDDGLATILWVKGGVGEADATGEQWAVIRLGGGSGLPTPQYKDMVFQGLANNAVGFDYPRMHAMIS